MKKSVLYFVLIFITSGVFLSSCAVEGCTDAEAENFNEDAKKDDGTCQFQGSIVFWYDKATSEALVSVNSIALAYYVDNQLIGSSAGGVYFSSAPDCGQSSTVTYVKDLGSQKTQVANYKVVDNDNYIIWEGVVNINASTCLELQLQ